MRVAKWILLGLGFALTTAACGIPTRAGADFVPGLDMGRYRTFGLDEAAISQTGDVRLEQNPFFEERLVEAIERELAARGIRRDESSPEMMVHFHLTVEDHLEVYDAEPQSGSPISEVGVGTEILQYEQGTFVVHFEDPETHEYVWVGWAEGDMGPALADSEEMRKFVDEAVTLMFQHLPAQTN
jgi:hypothetical protein